MGFLDINRQAFWNQQQTRGSSKQFPPCRSYGLSPDDWLRGDLDASLWSWHQAPAPASGGQGKYRNTGTSVCKQVFDHWYRIFARCRWITRSVGQKDSIRIKRQIFPQQLWLPATTLILQPREANRRKILRLMPKSIATICGLFSASYFDSHHSIARRTVANLIFLLKLHQSPNLYLRDQPIHAAWDFRASISNSPSSL